MGLFDFLKQPKTTRRGTSETPRAGKARGGGGKRPRPNYADEIKREQLRWLREKRRSNPQFFDAIMAEQLGYEGLGEGGGGKGGGLITPETLQMFGALASGFMGAKQGGGPPQLLEGQVIQQPAPPPIPAPVPEYQPAPPQPEPPQQERPVSITGVMVANYIVGQLKQCTTPADAANWILSQSHPQAREVVTSLQAIQESQIMTWLDVMERNHPDMQPVVTWFRQRPDFYRAAAMAIRSAPAA